MEFGDGLEVETVLVNDDTGLDVPDLLTPKLEAEIVVDCGERERELILGPWI